MPQAQELLARKAEHASYLVTQMLFDAPALAAWVAQLREDGIGLPVRPGIAGPASRARLLRVGARIGVGRLLRMLTAEGSGVRRLLSPGHWDGDELLEALEAAGIDTLAAPHVYTFNALEATARWWGARGT